MPPEIPIYEETWFVPALLGGLLLFQVLLLLVVLALSGKVSRLARMIAARDAGPAAGPELTQKKEENSEQKKQFAKFLEENPSRKELPKKEQFAEFRKWRDEKGLNWKSAGEG
ncbi:hypothetical protein [Haloferula sp. BvORR071]|uniref:hypothetical protein n=1 Tax=Haloferula sp. BvORR071 TaxID=1396141 RepID=UPI0005530F72|nr:hypothetical protein [Haloferula sp. BvORR071]